MVEVAEESVFFFVENKFLNLLKSPGNDAKIYFL